MKKKSVHKILRTTRHTARLNGCVPRCSKLSTPLCPRFNHDLVIPHDHSRHLRPGATVHLQPLEYPPTKLYCARVTRRWTHPPLGSRVPLTRTHVSERMVLSRGYLRATLLFGIIWDNGCSQRFAYQKCPQGGGTLSNPKQELHLEHAERLAGERSRPVKLVRLCRKHRVRGCVPPIQESGAVLHYLFFATQKPPRQNHPS